VKIGLIAPYPSLVEVGVRLQKYYPIQVEEGDLREGLKKALKLQREGFEAIVTRGGTALLIKSSPQIHVPVIEIKVTGYDILEALTRVSGLKGKTAIIGFPNVIAGGRKIATCLKLNIRHFEIKDEDEVNSCLQKVKTLGISNIVGDHIVVEKAKFFNMDTVLIRSGEEAVKKALEEAENTVEAIKKEVEKTERYRTILDSIHEGIVVVDDKREIALLNRQAENLLEVRKNKILGKKLNVVLNDLDIKRVWETGEKLIGHVIKNKGKAFVANLFPIKVQKEVLGVVVNLTPLEILQDTEIKVRRNLYKNGLVAEANFAQITKKSKIMKKIIERAQKYAVTGLTILISGETGTGKDIFAQSIHNHSPFQDKPFVTVNCATLPESLLELELFGYEEGAFTGAKRGGKPGLFELAHKGTIFLDEIAEMPLSLQNRLLRVIEEKKIRRVGGTKIIPVDVRIIAATNKDLPRLVAEGKFRKDLYYRINVLHLHLPPLRERKEDIIPIFEETISDLCKDSPHEPDFEKIRSDFNNVLLSYNWPGNIRELINFAKRLFFLSEGLRCSQTRLRQIAISELGKQGTVVDNNSAEFFNGTLREIEENILQRYVMENRRLGKSMSEIARELGISRTTLWKRLKNK